MVICWRQHPVVEYGESFLDEVLKNKPRLDTTSLAQLNLHLRFYIELEMVTDSRDSLTRLTGIDYEALPNVWPHSTL